MKTATFLMSALVYIFSAPVWAQSSSDWVDIKDPRELRDLYTNRTFRGTGWVGHYRADGKGILIVGKLKPEPRTWVVKGNDQVCVTLSDGRMTCSRFQRNRVNPKEVTVTNLTTGQSFMFTVEDGVPNF